MSIRIVRRYRFRTFALLVVETVLVVAWAVTGNTWPIVAVPLVAYLAGWYAAAAYFISSITTPLPAKETTK